MDLESIPVARLNKGELSWCSSGFERLAGADKEKILSSLGAIPNGLFTEFLIPTGPFRSAYLIPLTDSDRLAVFSVRGENTSIAPSSAIELLSLLVHDLRSPITSIYGYSDAVLESSGVFTADDVLAFVKKIRSSALRANVLLSNMQALAAGVKVSRKARSFQLNHLVKEILDGVWLDPSVRVKVELDSLDTTVTLDHLAVERIVGNLFNNAAKFLTKNGEIRVTTLSHRDSVELKVFNTGPKILPSEIPLIFDKFHRGKSAEGTSGTGLGLFIVKQLTEQLGAAVAVESSDIGTTFSVSFPRILKPTD